jgi:hypothetical protein
MTKQLPRLKAVFRPQAWVKDHLARYAGVGGDHSGPFEVDVDEEDFNEFFERNGLDAKTVTDEQWEALRRDYGVVVGATPEHDLDLPFDHHYCPGDRRPGDGTFMDDGGDVGSR